MSKIYKVWNSLNIMTKKWIIGIFALLILSVIPLISASLEEEFCPKSGIYIDTEKGYTYYDRDNKEVSLMISRGVLGDVNLEGIRVEMINSNKDFIYSKEIYEGLPGENEERTYSLDASMLEDVAEISVAPIIIKEGNIYVCSSTDKIYVSEETGSITQECTDSDGGDEIYVRGKATAFEYDEFLYYEDKCAVQETPIEGYYVEENGVYYVDKDYCEGDNCYIAESYCSGDAGQFKIHKCSNGCENGVCKGYCSVDASGCMGLNYPEVMYGIISIEDIWDGQKFTATKACIAKEDGTISSGWSFEQPDCAIINEIEKDLRPAYETISDEEEKIEPIKLPIKEEITDEPAVMSYICGGCLLEDICYPLGYRKAGQYCSGNKEFVQQLGADSACDNNFECESNICAGGKCISMNLIEKILNWFKKLFGIE